MVVPAGHDSLAGQLMTSLAIPWKQDVGVTLSQFDPMQMLVHSRRIFFLLST